MSQRANSTAASLQSQDNLMHVLESENYTPSQVQRALQTALDDKRSFHFDKVVRLARVACLAHMKGGTGEAETEAETDPESETGAQRALLFDLVQIFAAGDISAYLARQDDFAPLMQEFPQRVEKLKAISLRRLTDALDDPDVFDFSEFLDLVENPRCAEFLGPAAAPAIALLDLLAFRMLDSPEFASAEAAATGGHLPPAHLHKLRKLSLSSLAAANKVLSYATLQDRLNIAIEGELEEFLIDAITSKVVVGTIDQRAKTLHVASCMARHVPHVEIGKLLHQLADWMALSNGVIAQVDAKIEQLQKAEKAAAKREADLTERVKAELNLQQLQWGTTDSSSSTNAAF